jgi:hypothetical protein
MSKEQTIFGGCCQYPYLRMEIKITDTVSNVFQEIKKNIQNDNCFTLIDEDSTQLKIKWKSPGL